jgi:metal-sulfur cluster biosynthetic enzyme
VNDELLTSVRATLNAIIDPCSVAAGCPAGLVDMGLVRSVELNGESPNVRVEITLAVTHPFCMMSAVFVNEARIRVGEISGVSACEVELDATVVWTDDDMTPEYAARRQQSLIDRGIVIPVAVGQAPTLVSSTPTSSKEITPCLMES